MGLLSLPDNPFSLNAPLYMTPETSAIQTRHDGEGAGACEVGGIKEGLSVSTPRTVRGGGLHHRAAARSGCQQQLFEVSFTD